MRIYTHPEYLNHLVMDGHPERPERLVHLMNHWQRIGLTQDFQMIEPQPIPSERILAAHSQSHMDFLQASPARRGFAAPGSGYVDECCQHECCPARRRRGLRWHGHGTEQSRATGFLRSQDRRATTPNATVLWGFVSLTVSLLQPSLP